MLCASALNSIGTAPWVTVLAAAREAALTGTSGMMFCLLSLLAISSINSCPVYGAFVAAVVTMVSLLAWAVNSSSFAFEMSMHVLPRKSYNELRT